MERITPQNVEVVAVGVGETERGCIHEGMSEGRRYFPAVKDHRISLEEVSVYRNEGNDLCAYHALVKGACWSKCDISSSSFDVREMKKSIFATCFSWVTGACVVALADGCDKLTPEAFLTASQVASLKCMGFPLRNKERQNSAATIENLRAQMIDMIQMSEWTSVSMFSFAAPLLERNIAVWERSDDGEGLIPYTRSNPAGSCDGLFFFGKASKTIHIFFSDGKDTARSATDVGESGGHSLVQFEFLVLEETAEERIAKSIRVYNPEEGPSPSVIKGLVSCSDVHRVGKATSVSESNARGDDVCEARIASGPRKRKRCTAPSKPPGSGRCRRHKGKVSQVIRLQQPHRDLPAPETVGDDDDIPLEGEPDEEETMPMIDLPDDEDGSELPDVPGEEAKVIAKAGKIKEIPYRDAFKCVHGLHVGNDREGSGKRVRQWTSEGIAGDAKKNVFDRTGILESDKSSFKPTAETLERFPAVTFADIEIWDLEDESKEGPFSQRMAFEAFQAVFPQEAVNLIATKTNEYHDLCQGKLPNRKAAQGGRHDVKSSEWSGQKWPEGGIGKTDVLAMVGLLIHMGVVNLPRMEDHWSADPFNDFRLVRNCMPRDFFFLIYSRFFHVADSVNDVEVVKCADDAEEDIRKERNKLKDKYEDARKDRMHQIRELQEILNNAWSTVVHVSAILALGEQMVLDVSRAGSGLQRFNYKKPIKRGLKRWAVADQTGWCYVSYTDVGMKNDPKLEEWDDDPLGRITRVVLFVMLSACASFSRQVKANKIFLALDNIFTSPILLLCLAYHGILGFGTVRRNRVGVSGAFEFWASNQTDLGEKGSQRFARTTDERYPLAITEWRESRDVLFASTAHVFDKDTRCMGYEKRNKGGVLLQSTQPAVRASYNSYMGGVDVADKRCGSYLVNHKPKGFFWRRVFDQSLFTALTNAELLYQWWVEDSLVKVREAFVSIGLDGPEDETVSQGPAEGLTRLQLKAIQRRLKTLLYQLGRRPAWKKDLGKYLMVRFHHTRDLGDGDVYEKLKAAPSGKTWETVLEHGRPCNGPGCSTLTTGACRCQDCRKHDEYGVVICWGCFNNPKKHAEAPDIRHNVDTKGRLKKRIPWERLAQTENS